MSDATNTLTNSETVSPTPTFTKVLIPWLVAIAYFMEALDTTILNTAVPVIANAMQVAPLSLKAVLASYTLSLAVFIPISGWLADRYGTRHVFANAMGLFVLSSLLCGLSHNIYLLTIFRIVQGCAGAMMVPVGRLVLVRTFDKSELVRVLSFVTIAGWSGPVLGPVLGGAIITHFSWSMIFYVNIPIGLVGLLLIWMYLPDYREQKAQRLDIVGFFLFGSGIALLSYILEVFGDNILPKTLSLALLVLSLVLIFFYGWHSNRTNAPLLQLSLLHIRTFRIAVIGSFVARLGVGGVPFLLPLLYQLAIGYTPMKSGLLILPQAIAGILAKLCLPRILDMLGYKIMLITNTFILSGILMLFATVTSTTPIWLIVLQAACYGACTSLQYTSMNTMAYADIDDQNASKAGSIASTAQELSISFGIATAGLVTALFVPEVMPANMTDMMGSSLSPAFLVLGGLTFFSSFIFMGLEKNDGDQVTHHRKTNSQQSHRNHR